jgi:holo-[acyl-carrier protein] synthase
VIGVDVLEAARVERLLARYGRRMHRTIATPAETAWVGSSALRMAGLFAVKEAVIKALGGRGQGFRWTDIVVVPGVRPEPLPAVAVAALDGFAAGIPATTLTPVLAELQGNLPASRAVARWGGCGGYLYAVAVVW